MKPVCILSALMAIAVTTAAQEKIPYAYAITGQQGNSVQGWTELRQIDLRKGAVASTVYESARVYDIYAARSGKRIPVDGMPAESRLPFSTYVAACAFDAKHNRLYFTPMGINQLRYADLSGKQPVFYYFDAEPFGVSAGLQDAANHITRMAMASDGNGYALSNDAHHLIRFGTGKKPEITDLGSLTDDPSNGGISVHNQCSSWGGDMVADAAGNLYLIGATQSLFKVQIKSKVATYLGHIGGLPPQFTINGAAVTAEGKLIVGSANSTLGYYEVDLAAMRASLYSDGPVSFTSSDLASPFLLFDQAKKVEGPAAVELKPTPFNQDESVSVFPNPVTEGVFNVYFNQLVQGRYTIQILHQSGALVHQQVVATQFKGQVNRVEVDRTLTKGVYIVKVTNDANREVHTTKVIVQ